MILSALMSANMVLPTSFGNIAPNMWFQLLADTTLTRKTTAMNLASKLLNEVDKNAFMASDGSIEGILSALKERSGRTSLYMRDEFSGFLDAMVHKDYFSGMMEYFTKLYDGDSIKRLLRREEIVINNPVFLMLTAGTKTRTSTILTEEHISSGFIPRFVFITAVPDPDMVRPIGPPIDRNTEARDLLKNELMDLYTYYTRPREMIYEGRTAGTIPPMFEVNLTPEAWKRYNAFETQMTNTALASGLGHLTPVYDRLAKSTLKAAMLIAASRQRNNTITMELDDLLHALYYCSHWYGYANEVVSSVGMSQSERLIEVLHTEVNSTLGGVTRAELMRRHKMDMKQADLIFGTMLERGMITGNRYGRNIRYTGE